MLNTPAQFPHAGATAYIDDIDGEGRDVVEQVRIIAHKPGKTVLIAIRSRRFPGEVASGNRTVPLSSLRETERAEITQAPKRRARSARK